MATLTETLAEGRTRIEGLRLPPFEREQLLQTLSAIEAVTAPAREKVSEALTILRDPAMVSRMAHASVAAATRLEQALALLDGEDQGGR